MPINKAEVERNFNRLYDNLKEKEYLAKPVYEDPNPSRRTDRVLLSGARWISAVIGDENDCVNITALYFGRGDREGDIELRLNAHPEFLVIFHKQVVIQIDDPLTRKGKILRMAKAEDLKFWKPYIEDLIQHPGQAVRRSI